jgi:hypothetical protein
MAKDPIAAKRKAETAKEKVDRIFNDSMHYLEKVSRPQKKQP